MHHYKSIGFLFIIVCITACSTEKNAARHVQINDLAGLWNSSENADVMYTRIMHNGDIIEYDFDGDVSDHGLNCYQIVSGAMQHVEGNRFLVSVDMLESKSFEVEFELLDAGHALSVHFFENNKIAGVSDEGGRGKSQIWTREPDDSMLDKEPSCKP